MAENHNIYLDVPGQRLVSVRIKAHRTCHLAGRRFGHWLVISGPVRDSHFNSSWLCRGDCGRDVYMRQSTLLYRRAPACVCEKPKPVSPAPRKPRIARMTGGLSHLSEYPCWAEMIQRCYNPKRVKFRYYGARGITVCDRWRNSFKNFLADMGPRPSRDHTLDRKDNNGNYEPHNCRWATRLEQSSNRSDSRHISFRGETHIISEWARITGLKSFTIHYRLEHGWTIERTLTTPAKR